MKSILTALALSLGVIGMSLPASAATAHRKDAQAHSFDGKAFWAEQERRASW